MSDSVDVPRAAEAKTLLDLPKSDETLYFNGFQLGIGAGDVIIALLLNNRPVLTLNASFTVAKTLAEALRNTVDILEASTSREIMTLDDIQHSRRKMNELATSKLKEHLERKV